MKIIISAILPAFYLFRRMKKTNFDEKNTILDSPSKRAAWEEKNHFSDKSE